MRGTPGIDCVRRAQAGIIPAHAGNTKMPRRRISACRDHPRACGEHVRLDFAPAADWGSSPRMRGTPELKTIFRKLRGIIPAHAGNTKHGDDGCSNDRDHPRACGEHQFRSNAVTSDSGSSPRMRGTPVCCMCNIGTYGIIPAHAGNTKSWAASSSSVRDHPRACGEHARWSARSRPRAGSSPRMRGTLSTVTTVPHMAGIIPAHAGNTCLLYVQHWNIWDHPRACGEHPRHAAHQRATFGIIPAHAGNTA